MNDPASVVLITGAGNGIGRELARMLAAVDVRTDDLRSLADELQPAQRKYAWINADVTDAAGLQAAVRSLEAQLGPTDILIANAGVGMETSGLNYRIDDMNRILGVNLLGVSNSIGAVLPGMLERRRGHRVAISSVASFRGLPRMLGYCASKAGVNAIMDGLRVELQPLGIDVTTICPGWVRTAMTATIASKAEHIMEPDAAAREIVYAIHRKLPFYAFPGPMRRRLRVLTALPLSWQDWYLRKMMARLTV